MNVHSDSWELPIELAGTQQRSMAHIAAYTSILNVDQVKLWFHTLTWKEHHIDKIFIISFTGSETLAAASDDFFFIKIITLPFPCTYVDVSRYQPPGLNLKVLQVLLRSIEAIWIEGVLYASAKFKVNLTPYSIPNEKVERCMISANLAMYFKSVTSCQMNKTPIF